MSLQEIVKEQTAKAQALFRQFNASGSDCAVRWQDGAVIDVGTVESWEVVKAEIVVDKDGKLLNPRFWVLGFWPYFHNDLHKGGHVFHVRRARQGQYGSLVLEEYDGREIVITAPSDEDRRAAWKAWNKERVRPEIKGQVEEAREWLRGWAREAAESWQS